MRQGKLVVKGSPKSLVEKFERDTLEEVFLQVNREDAP